MKDLMEEAAPVNEYVTAMKTFKRPNIANRKMKLDIGDELQTLFNPIVNATKQASEGMEITRPNEENINGYRWSFGSC